MKLNSVLAASCGWVIALPCLADTFTLKNGSSLEAEIVKETPDAYFLKVQVTKTIKDERKVPKADVVKVSREQPDFKAFQAIAKLVPTPDLITAEDCQARIAEVEKFLKNFRTAGSSQDAEVILTTLQNESTKISAGSIKVSGKFVTTDQYQADAYDLDARIQESKIRALVTDGEFLAALRRFSDFDTDYRTTLSYGALSSLIQQVILNQVLEARQSLATLPERLKQRDMGLLQMTTEDRATSTAAIQEESARLEARYNAEKNSKLKWVTADPFHKASLEDTAKFGETELARLSSVKTVLGVEGGKAYREVYKAVHDGGNGAAVDAALARAKVALVPSRYLAPLEEAAKSRK
jgi:hypothetical protein